MPPRKRNAAEPAVRIVGAGSIDPSPRNTQADREFIRANLNDFLHRDGSLVWSGRAEDIGHPYQLPPEHLRCSRARQLRDDEGGAILDVDLHPLKARCPQWAMRGTDLCVDHAKGSKAVMDGVRKRIVAASNEYFQQLHAIATDEAASDADRIKALNSLLDRGGLKAGIEISADVDSWAALRRAITEGDSD